MARRLARRYHHAMETDAQPYLKGDEVALGLPLVLRGKRSGAMLAVPLFIAMSTVAILIHRDKGGLGALACAVLFGLLAVLSLLNSITPPSLRIDEEGFVLDNSLRKGVLRRWTEIESIGLRNINHRPYAVYQVKPGVHRIRVPGGYTLPSCFEIPAPELAQMMEVCREQFGRGR